MSSNFYEHDFFAWANEQAALLRAGKLDAADIEHIAEEIESMGRSEKRELVSRLTVLLLHLLKWQFQPDRRGASWEASIANTRDDLADHLADNPSLKAMLSEAIISAYRRARRDAAAETGLPNPSFPLTCPWSFAQLMDENFWPGV
ncbi:DUF29 domain-containing protein [uncultured Gammaproteobacteria bacterium]